MILCGIDPGLEVSGYAVVRVNIAENGNPAVGLSDPRSFHIVDAGVCRTDPQADMPDRLAQIDADFTELFEQYAVDRVAIEQLYSHYKHPRTSVLMGHARGVIICCAARRGITVRDLAATQVKRYLTGNGRATKQQMQRAVANVFGLAQLPQPNDVADALAMAYCSAGQLDGRRRIPS